MTAPRGSVRRLLFLVWVNVTGPWCMLVYALAFVLGGNIGAGLVCLSVSVAYLIDCFL